MSDLSLDVKAELVTDSSACKGLCSRRGAGRIRHIHCPALWLQHAVARRQIAITRRAGKDLAPDVGTKAGIPEDTVRRLLGMFGLAKGEGRAKQALNMAGRQAKAWRRGYVTFARPILNDVHSSHALSTKLCSDCVGCHFVTIGCLAPKKCLENGQRYFFNCSSQFRVTCVFCLQFASFLSFSLKWFGTAGSLLFCNSRCNMCELGTLIFLVLHCLSWKVDRLRIHPVQNFNLLVSVFSHLIMLEVWWSCQWIAWRWHLATRRSWWIQRSSTDSMMSHSHLCQESSHGHQRHLHTSFCIFFIVNNPWNNNFYSLISFKTHMLWTSWISAIVSLLIILFF